MNEEKDPTKQEARRLVRMLVGISKTAREASLTGQLSGGKAVAIRQYNAILARLKELGVVSGDLFAPVSEEASFDEVGVVTSQLVNFLREDDEEERHRRWRYGGGVFEASPGHVKIVGFPGNIGELGDILREYLPDFIKQKVAYAFKEEAKKGQDVAAAAVCCVASPEEEVKQEEPESEPKASRLDDVESRLAEVGAQMQVVAERMRRADLSPDEVQKLADDLGKLAQRQAELARERERLRAGEQ